MLQRFAHSLHPGAPEPHPRKFESRRSRRLAHRSPKDQVVSSGSHPGYRCLILCGFVAFAPSLALGALNDQGLLNSYGVYRSPWIVVPFARHLVRKHRNTSGSSALHRAFPQRLFSPAVVTQFTWEEIFNRANRHKHTHGVKSLGIMRHCLLIGHKNLGPPPFEALIFWIASQKALTPFV